MTLKIEHTNILFFVIILFLVTNCQKHYLPIEISSEDFHHAQDQLTSVMVHDIFSPPLASRVYAYSNIAAHEILAQEKIISSSMQKMH